MAFVNVPAGRQNVTIKSGHGTQTQTITVGAYKPGTLVYETQDFSLTAGKNGGSSAFILTGIVVVCVVAFVVFQLLGGGNKPFNKWGNGGHSKTGSTPSGSRLSPTAAERVAPAKVVVAPAVPIPVASAPAC
ncbi:MAG: hypothetical protein WDN27_03750 [Candidatus Saccharibacteria bacterium]